MNRTGIIGGGIAVLVVVALAWWLVRPRAETSPALAQKAAVAAPASEPTIATPDAPPANSSGDTTGQTDAQDVNTIDVTGVVQADAQAALSVRQPARIVSVLVREGQTVQRGQLLVVLDNREGSAQAATAQAGVRVAQAQAAKARAGRDAQKVKADNDVATAQAGVAQGGVKVQQAKLARDAAASQSRGDIVTAREGVRKAEAALTQAQNTLRSLESLSEVGGVSRSDLNGARTQVTVAEADLVTAQQGLQQAQNGYRVALAAKDVDAAQAGLRQAQTGLQTALRARHDVLALATSDIQAAQAGVEQAQAGVSGASLGAQTARLVSPLRGIATGLNARAGEIAQPGMPLVTIVAPDALHVDALVSARDVARLRVGQDARIEDEPARIVEISLVAEPGGRTVRVRLHPHSNTHLRIGQSVRVRLKSPVSLQSGLTPRATTRVPSLPSLAVRASLGKGVTRVFTLFIGRRINIGSSSPQNTIYERSVALMFSSPPFPSEARTAREGGPGGLGQWD